ncbi:uncharacterized protein DC041_0009915 [Schistosoma bovis]|uniref:Geminin n=1 Tax=Schistosoma bovis TaxID=6184 RepID=A0A430QRG1_SCHBO|nr:uncharacterized protein DC041_0009915 [Schistosoma bovis]
MMESQRRGLRVLNTSEHIEPKKTQLPVEKKPGIVPAKHYVKEPIANKPVVNKVAPFIIFQDPIETHCQHCGALRSKSQKDQHLNPSKEYKETAIQVEVIDLNAWLCSEQAPEKYWETVAEQRRVALKETLDENLQLCELVEKLNFEIERLSAIASSGDHIDSMYNQIFGGQEARSNLSAEPQEPSCEPNPAQLT